MIYIDLIVQSAGLCNICARLAPLLLQQPNTTNDHRFVYRLAHVINRQQRDLCGGERFHLDAGRAYGLGAGVAADGLLRRSYLELH